MRIVGADLSLTSSGLAVLDDGGWQLARVRSTGAAEATWAQRASRLAHLAQRIAAVVEGADLLVIEGPAYSRAAQAGAHDRAGLWWAVVAGARAASVAVAVASPSARARYATGRGNAGKDEVLLAVARRYPLAPITGNDEADAVALAAMGARALGEPVDTVSAPALAAVAAVAWPDPLPGR